MILDKLFTILCTLIVLVICLKLLHFVICHVENSSTVYDNSGIVGTTMKKALDGIADKNVFTKTELGEMAEICEQYAARKYKDKRLYVLSVSIYDGMSGLIFILSDKNGAFIRQVVVPLHNIPFEFSAKG